MSQDLKALEKRCQELQLQAGKERGDLALHFEPWEKPLSWADKGVDIFHFFKNNPIILTGAFATLAHYKPKLASRILSVGWGAMKLIKSTKSLI
jgi:YqjK-like protein